MGRTQTSQTERKSWSEAEGGLCCCVGATLGPGCAGVRGRGPRSVGTDSGAGVPWRPAEVLSVNCFHPLETFQN